MNIFITGGLGHIGSFLMRKITESINTTSITVVDSMQTQRYSSLFNLPSSLKHFFIEKNVNELIKKDFFLNGNIDCVIHLAATTDASGTADQSEALFKNNLGSTKAIVQLCGELKIPLIFPSTTSVYGSQSLLVDETCKELFPQSPYAICKLEEEEEVRNATKVGLSAAILRLGTIHGVSEGMRFHTAVNKFCYQAAYGQPISVWKTAFNQKRPYLSLIDASRAIAHVVENKIFNGETYNVVTKNHTVKNIIDSIELTLGHKCDINFVENKIMNQLSYEVCTNKFADTGFKFIGDMSSDISNTIRILIGQR